MGGAGSQGRVPLCARIFVKIFAQWARLAPRGVQLCLSTHGDNQKSEGDMPMPTHMNCMAYFSCNMRLSRDSMRAASESR